MSIAHTILKTVCAGASVLAVCAGSVAMVAPALAADNANDNTGGGTSITVDDAVFEWGVNPETGGGSYFGGCNALSAGTAGDAGGSGVWTAAKTGKDGKPLYRTVDESAHAEILKLDQQGDLKRVESFDARCTNRAGESIKGATGGMKTSSGNPTYSENVVRLSDGQGTIDAATSSAHIEWKGASFTIVYYGGMTYWSIADPVLDITNGKGTLTGTATGYGADMSDPGKWTTLAKTTIRLADFTTGAQSGAENQIAFDTEKNKLTATPDYLGVTADTGAEAHSGQAEKTNENAAWWGSFPASWVQYNIQTGQSSYWYTTSGSVNSIQPRKVASPVVVTWGGGQTTGKPSLAVKPKGVELGKTITFEATNLDDGKQYDVTIKDRNGNAVSWKDENDKTWVWTYTVPATASTGDYTFELREHGTAEGADPLLTAKFTVGSLPGAPRLTNHDDEGTDRVELFWNAPMEQPGYPSFSGFKAVAKPSSGNGESVSASFGSDERSGMITGLKSATTYTVTIMAVNDIGDGPASNAMTITTKTSSSGGGSDDNGNGGNGNGSNGSGNTTDGTAYKDVTLRWGINDETNSAAYYGGCNFISAGKAGNTGSSKTWTSAFYKAKDGNVSVEKPNSSGTWVAASWDSKCLTRDGDTVKMEKRADGRSVNSETQVVLSKGAGTVKSDGSVEISWTGSFTVAYYGGMTYWSVTDPKLTLDASGNGALTATASGYGADMNDSSKWVTLSPRTIHLADFKGVDVKKAASAHGFTKTPEYLGVKVTASGDHGGQAAKDGTNAAYWGAFPQSFVDFQVETGQSAYWYTANSQRDFAKPTLPLSVQYDSTFKVSAGSGSPAAATASGGRSSSSSGLGGGLLSRGGASSTTKRKSTTSTGKTTKNNADASSTADDGDAGSETQTNASGNDASPLIADNARTIAIGSGGVAAATALPLGIGWFIRRRLGLDPSAALDSRLGL
ncbi:fibronectin type III domain-containing protein [Bifidobacterium catulorum]|uniref:Fibronectin type-III domain-containing protein n=1 Tax=Bifidobacterium catulorum TaxID=1630173 RepID=A0A2U2MUS1_9BIFI|nr:fibronectin type III domain-containing protein [Bifidobacterium catulorum]PWG60585.1 hypothetical protein DF200_01510 [Bifidobacterium catulorum]